MSEIHSTTHRSRKVYGNIIDNGQKLALRDAVLVSACDGDYDKKEIRIIKKIAKIAGVDNDALSEIYQWVEDYWSVYKRSNDFLR
ncbi:MAG: hypothetical protein CM15mP3_11120 [Candidatus Poseidoniales archaeon]|nr:MAG: hypothetical protein CM15mP3_11120 [Candidatus Poseidoniales archaeon]